ncbi:MAG: c-type cytochrome domain-containing protein [Pirellulaceae bacterium]
MPRRLARLLLAVAVAMTLPVFGRAADPASEPNASNDAQGIQFFETKVRPLLVKHCYECHGEDAQESDLRLDTHDGIIRGGRSGMAVVAGKPTQSLLLTAVGYQDANLRMPPETKLAAAEVADLRRWIEIELRIPTPTLLARRLNRAKSTSSAAVRSGPFNRLRGRRFRK